MPQFYCCCFVLKRKWRGHWGSILDWPADNSNVLYHTLWLCNFHLNWTKVWKSIADLTLAIAVSGAENKPKRASGFCKSPPFRRGSPSYLEALNLSQAELWRITTSHVRWHSPFSACLSWESVETREELWQEGKDGWGKKGSMVQPQKGLFIECSWLSVFFFSVFIWVPSDSEPDSRFPVQTV